ncbi:hypothetical protein NM688_g1992 [Phlebia brevispora]|uniref:Uncharacterized protein n=1 Tax=Phlebia brevispora TaxID=194682 RepID=A0ACC1T9R7_9APHY|nr:hypothetical protein NM688_g1992 [Phlebia brevispora]
MLFGYLLSLASALLATAFRGPALGDGEHSLLAQTRLGYGSYDTGLFTPLESLSLLKATEYTSLAHPAFPKYQVRIKKSDFCDGSVRFDLYTNARNLVGFYRRSADKDDVIFWTNGGPGCSSALGLFMELGPCRVSSANDTVYNPYGWNEYANVFFIDQPIGVGFSYAEYGESVGTTGEAAKDIAAFVAIFFEHFTSFRGRAFHMAGESYGGRYIPVFAAEIYDQNIRLEQAGVTPINLTSIMIGNGCTDDITMTLSYYDMQCTPKSVPPIMDIGTCVAIKRGLARCDRWMRESCADTFDAISCGAANMFCTELIMGPFDLTGYNPYDISKTCDGALDDTLCYPITKNISSYLDQPYVRKVIGVDPAVSGNFSRCSDRVAHGFNTNMDSLFPTQYYIAALLERGVRTLLYVGANDWICNWVGNERMSLAMEWSGHEDFNKEPLRDWNVGDNVAGLTRNAGPLTFATVYGAGHMVPYDKPKEALELTPRTHSFTIIRPEETLRYVPDDSVEVDDICDCILPSNDPQQLKV